MKKREKRRQTTYRFSDEQHKWLDEEAERIQESKNTVLRRLVAEAMAAQRRGNNG